MAAAGPRAPWPDKPPRIAIPLSDIRSIAEKEADVAASVAVGTLVTLTTVYVPDVGGDLATLDAATRDAMLAYLGTKNARLVRAAFSHDALRP